MKRARIVVLSLCAFLSLSGLAGADGVAERAVTGPRVQLADLVPGAPDVDLGPVPAPGGSRIIDRAEIERAATAQGKTAPKSIPASVRVIRKMRAIAGPELEKLARDGAANAIPRGATLVRVRVAAQLSVADGFDRVSADLPRPPRRAGQATVTGTLAFFRGSEELARTPLVVDFSLTAEAAAPDVAQGSAILLLVRRGLVELRIPATVGADAEIGGTVPVTVRTTGKTLRARVLDREHALVAEGS